MSSPTNAPVEGKHIDLVEAYIREHLFEDMRPKRGAHQQLATMFADLEAAAYARGLADGAGPFEALMSFYDEGQRVELYVGEGGSRYAESPSAYGFGDDARRAALALCSTLGIETPGESE